MSRFIEAPASAPLVLSEFLPYRLAIVADAVSKEVSCVYREQYKLSRDEWRILAALGEMAVIKTSDVRRCATLDKVQASRAIVRMEKVGLLSRREDKSDRRNHIIQLTPDGLALYRELVPAVKGVEESILAGFSKAELDAFQATLTRLLAATKQRSGLKR